MTRIVDYASSITTMDDDILSTCKALIKGTEFIGEFKYRQHVPIIQNYRDVVTISADQHKFIENLVYVKHRLSDSLTRKTWIGITTATDEIRPNEYNLWVVIPNHTFGKFLFRVKGIEMLPNEIQVKLKVVRQVDARERTPLSQSQDTEEEEDYMETLKVFGDEVLAFLKSVITWENITQSVSFLVILITSLSIGLFNMTQYLLEFSLKLLKELRLWVKDLNPIVISVFRAVTSIAIAMIMGVTSLFGKGGGGGRGNQYLYNQPALMIEQSPYQNYPARNRSFRHQNNYGYNNNYRQRRSGPIITEVE